MLWRSLKLFPIIVSLIIVWIIITEVNLCQFNKFRILFTRIQNESIKLDSSLHWWHYCPFVVVVVAQRLVRLPPCPMYSIDYRLRSALIRFLRFRRQTMNDTFWQLSPNRRHSRCVCLDAVQNSAVILVATNAPPTMQLNLNIGKTVHVLIKMFLIKAGRTRTGCNSFKIIKEYSYLFNYCFVKEL